MEEFASAFKTKYPKINLEEELQIWADEDEQGDIVEREVVTYNVTSIPGLDNLTLNLHSSDEFEKLDQLVSSQPTLFTDFLGGRFGNDVEVVLTKITRTMFRPRTGDGSLTIELAYQGATVSVTLAPSRRARTQIGFIASNLVGVRALQANSSAIAVVKGLDSANPQALEADTAKILRSVLFDFEYTYGFAFETTNLENLKNAQAYKRRRSPPLPTEPVRLLFKPYVPELIEYFHVAERVDYLPFKYICYFHVLEYFMDKSAYSVVSRKVKQILLSPDFHLRSAEYISNAVNIIKIETERNTTDKIKIGRVIGEFAQRDAVQKHLTAIEVQDHFNKDHTLNCAKPLKLSAIKFDSDQSFVDSMARRIYAMRCSIVHSNPDFDESKAVPFIPSPKNIEFLRVEIELIKELSRTIICNSH
ncbi:MAG: hypothetical protein ACN6PB_26775 [Achromobacter kerstersii]|uniref:hypothetical protein n=1 Tax=Achromobacter kerstersii TaxID=1353890 RepID=UPI003CFFADB0